MSVSKSLGTHRRLDLPQGVIEYREVGEGEPIIFLNGAIVNGDIWRNVVPEFSSKYRCITPDMPFGGHSIPLRAEADLSVTGQLRLLTDLLDALGLDSATVVAHDCAGALSHILASQNPKKFKRLVVIACDSHGSFPPRYFKPVRWAALLPFVGQYVFHSAVWKAVEGMWVRSVYIRTPPAHILASYHRGFSESKDVRRDFVKFFRTVRPGHTLRAARNLGRFPHPVLVVWAANDIWFQHRHGRRLANAFPDARMAVIPHARTFVPEDQPLRLARVISDFLAETSNVSDTARLSPEISPESEESLETR